MCVRDIQIYDSFAVAKGYNIIVIKIVRGPVQTRVR